VNISGIVFLYQDVCAFLKVRTHACKDAYATSSMHTQLKLEKYRIHFMIV